MSEGKLQPIQRRVLAVLAGMEPPWTLVGGAALAEFHLGHRETRDLDLFWTGLAELGDLGDRAIGALRAAGLTVERREVAPAFTRVVAGDGLTSTVIDFVADPVTSLEPPLERLAEERRILVATSHDILVDKLCALLGRSEPRDLVDLRALLAAGHDLSRALADAPRRDAGFSPLTLAWVLRSLPDGPLAAWDADLPAYRDELVDQLVALAGPE